MLHRYETDYGIYNHDADRNPYSLALVAMHPAENPMPGCKLYERMRRFAKSKVGDVFHISFTDFIQLPTHMVLEMFQIAEDVTKANNTVTDSVVSEMEKALKGNGS